MATSKKYRLFTQEPMDNKSVMALPGVGEASGRMLQQRGYTQATDLYKKFDDCGKDKQAFQAWMKDSCGASTNHSSATYDALKKWNHEFRKK